MQVFPYLNYFLIYVIFYIYFYFVGRSFLILENRIIFKSSSIPNKVIFTQSNYLYPIIGCAFVGNILILINFFFGLENNLIYFLLILLLIPNFLKIDKFSFNINFQKFINYFLIPGVLIVSTFNTGWHYDAGFYHLNHQHWLQQSNIIEGMVNIHWTFGMSSIYEYLSAILWFGNNFFLLHFLNLLFIHSFYIVLLGDILSDNKVLKNSSFFLLVFSLLDNFGIYGGRNGFLFIQGVTKQDTSVAILFLLISRSILIHLKDKNVNFKDISLISFLTLFSLQIKLSSFPVALFLIYFYFVLIKNQKVKFKKLFNVNLITTIFAGIWIAKQYITTGCFIFPVNFSCLNNFDWYLPGSTLEYELATRNWSYSLSLYDYKLSDWISGFISVEENYAILINFLLSLMFLLFLKIVFFKKTHIDNNLKIIIFLFILINIIYLVLYGPTPRYLMGIMLVIISLLGFFVDEAKFKNLFNFAGISLVILSVALLVRSTSYVAIFGDNASELFDPRPIAKYVDRGNGWVGPDIGDQCWINLECTMTKSDITIEQDGIFKKAIRN